MLILVVCKAYYFITIVSTYKFCSSEQQSDWHNLELVWKKGVINSKLDRMIKVYFKLKIHMYYFSALRLNEMELRFFFSSKHDKVAGYTIENTYWPAIVRETQNQWREYCLVHCCNDYSNCGFTQMLFLNNLNSSIGRFNTRCNIQIGRLFV